MWRLKARRYSTKGKGKLTSDADGEDLHLFFPLAPSRPEVERGTVRSEADLYCQ